MNSTLSKSVRVLVAAILCVLICFSLTACTKNTKNLKNVDQICVSGSYAESWMNVFADKDFVAEMVELYNGVKYEKSEEYVDMMTNGEVLNFTFYNGAESVATFIVDKNLNLAFKAGGQAYHIVSDFDFDYVTELVNEQKEMTKAKLEATPDQK